jgi:hypothetical protein
MGEGWEGVPAQLGGNRRVHAFGVRQHLVIPEPEDPVTLLLQEMVALRFLLRAGVLTAVDFDNQARVVANEIDNVTPERHLRAKSMSIDLARSQEPPHPSFRIGHIGSQGARSIVGAIDRILLHLRNRPRGVITPSQPSRIEGEGLLPRLNSRASTASAYSRR